MPISSRIRRHLQSHVVGYIALFVALSGTALALPGHKQVKSSIKRAGRVYVIATALTDCTAAPCNYGVMIDNGPVEHATITLNQPAVEKQVTMIGLTGPLAAGGHLISLIHAGGPLTISHVRLSGVLIQ
jgi:hypothetical protein